MNQNLTDAATTTDAWPWTKIVKHVVIPKPKGSPKAGKKEILTRAGFAAAFGLVALAMFTGDSLPACDSSKSASLLEEIVNGMPVARATGAKFVSLNNITELGFNDESEIRSCNATLVTTAGEDSLQYSIVWSDKDKGEYYIQAEVQ